MDDFGYVRECSDFRIWLHCSFEKITVKCSKYWINEYVPVKTIVTVNVPLIYLLSVMLDV